MMIDSIQLRVEDLERDMKSVKERLAKLERKNSPGVAYIGCEHDFKPTRIPCPDGKEGCLVMHYASICSKCGAREE